MGILSINKRWNKSLWKITYQHWHIQNCLTGFFTLDIVTKKYKVCEKDPIIHDTFDFFFIERNIFDTLYFRCTDDDYICVSKRMMSCCFCCCCLFFWFFLNKFLYTIKHYHESTLILKNNNFFFHYNQIFSISAIQTFSNIWINHSNMWM